jgi:Sigma-70 region 2
MPAARPARRTAPAPGDGGSRAVRLPGPFEHFYLEEYPKVVKLAYALSGSRSGAEDIAQEAFLRAYRDWDRVGSYEHQAAWVRRVAANLATSGLRRRLVEARALARLAARREPALDPLPAENADFWRAVRALPQRQARRSPSITWRTCRSSRPHGCWTVPRGRSGPTWPGPDPPWPAGWAWMPGRSHEP